MGHTQVSINFLVTVFLSCIVFEIWRDIGRKSPTWTYPTSVWCRRWGEPIKI